MKIKFTLADSVTDNRVLPEQQLEAWWDDFTELISMFEIEENKGDRKMLVPVDFKTADETDIYATYGRCHTGKIKMNDEGVPYVWKASINIKSWWMLPVDIDGEMSIEEAVEKFRDYEYVLYTSHSHQSEKKPYDCFRMFFPLSQPMGHEDFISRKKSMEEWVEHLDLSTLSSFRAFYLPSCPRSRQHLKVFKHNVGKFVDPTLFEVFIKPEPTYTRSSVDCDDKQKQHILELCQQICDIDYQNWWSNVCLPMISAGFSEHDFVEASQNMRTHRSGSDADAAYHWKSGVATTASGSTKTLGSLIWFLKETLGADCMEGFPSTKSTITKKQLKIDKLKERLCSLKKG